MNRVDESLSMAAFTKALTGQPVTTLDLTGVTIGPGGEMQPPRQDAITTFDISESASGIAIATAPPEPEPSPPSLTATQKAAIEAAEANGARYLMSGTPCPDCGGSTWECTSWPLQMHDGCPPSNHGGCGTCKAAFRVYSLPKKQEQAVP